MTPAATLETSASITAVATREVLDLLNPQRAAAFRLDRAKHLVELVLEQSGPTMNTGLALAPVVDKLLEARALGTHKQSLANDVALFEHILRLNAQSNPDQLLALGDGANLVARLIGNGKYACLEVLDEVYDTTHTARPALCAAACLAMHDVIARDDFVTSMQYVNEIPILRGWLDADTANAALSATCDFYVQQEDEVRVKLIRTYGGALASRWAWPRHVGDVARGLKACGGNLDIMVTARQFERTDDETPHRWTGTLLHQAVACGKPEFVRCLLALGCDPYLKSTRRDEVTGAVVLRDCFELIEGLEAQSEPDEEMRCRTADVAVLLRGWRAHCRAHDALAQLAVQAPGTP